MPPPKPEDLTEIPVFLSEFERNIFFSPLRPLFKGPALDGPYQCSECNEISSCIQVCFSEVFNYYKLI